MLFGLADSAASAVSFAKVFTMCNLFLGLMLISHWFACLWCVLRTPPSSYGAASALDRTKYHRSSIKNRFAASRMHEFDVATSWAGSYHSQGGTLSRAALPHPRPQSNASRPVSSTGRVLDSADLNSPGIVLSVPTQGLQLLLTAGAVTA